MADAILKQVAAKNLFNLKGVVAVVTGGGTGIGLMISTTLAANGADVYIIGPKQEDLDRIAKVYNDVVPNNPGQGFLYGIEGDISMKSEATRLASVIGSKAGHVTVLFNNAGISGGVAHRPKEATAEAYIKGFFDPLTQDDWNKTFNTNAVGPYWMTFAFLPLLEKWKLSGQPAAAKFAPQVIMTTSMNGWTKDFTTAGHQVPYVFSKAAIAQATGSLAHELIPLGIRVNGIAPGVFATEMTSPGTMNALGQSRDPKELIKSAGFQIPAGSAGSIRDVGSVALMLVTNRYINGETVLVDGGSFLEHPSSY
ncbi:NAD(P)-binding protein [Dentipellis sp. KUC8613]|nr:NAD(P)-binding protein [Dentipellis sp. KUC8613]